MEATTRRDGPDKAPAEVRSLMECVYSEKPFQADQLRKGGHAVGVGKKEKAEDFSSALAVVSRP